MTFEAFPKIPRLSKTAVITEKLDGTNAQVHITRDQVIEGAELLYEELVLESFTLRMYAGSRNRYLGTSSKEDNFGFAKWVKDNAKELIKLGEGRHFGEWWGYGIGRNYGLAERRFSLFNTARWGVHNPHTPICVSVVPVLSTTLTLDKVDDVMVQLKEHGSIAAPGFMNPEGVIVFYERQLFKKTFEHDTGKWLQTTMVAA